MISMYVFELKNEVVKATIEFSTFLDCTEHKDFIVNEIDKRRAVMKKPVGFNIDAIQVVEDELEVSGSFELEVKNAPWGVNIADDKETENFIYSIIENDIILYIFPADMIDEARTNITFEIVEHCF